MAAGGRPGVRSGAGQGGADEPPGVAVVTGAARGIGRGIAERLVRTGHRVVVTDVDGAAARRTAEEIGARVGLAHDVRDPQAHHDVAGEAARLGRVRAWFNNAGVGHDGDLAALSDAQVRELVEVNVLGALWGTRAAFEAFGSRGGDVVLVASLAGLGPVPGLSVYAATKAAVVSLAMSVHAETPPGVRIHALCPDGVDTAMVQAMSPDGTARALAHSGGRLRTVDEVADVAVGLLGSRRVVRSVPAWRGGLVRTTAVAPGPAARLLPLFVGRGRRVAARSE